MLQRTSSVFSSGNRGDQPVLETATQTAADGAALSSFTAPRS
jgi:hypothetical protein